MKDLRVTVLEKGLAPEEAEKGTCAGSGDQPIGWRPTRDSKAHGGAQGEATASHRWCRREDAVSSSSEPFDNDRGSGEGGSIGELSSDMHCNGFVWTVNLAGQLLEARDRCREKWSTVSSREIPERLGRDPRERVPYRPGHDRPDGRKAADDLGVSIRNLL